MKLLSLLLLKRFLLDILPLELDLLIVQENDLLSII